MDAEPLQLLQLICFEGQKVKWGGEGGGAGNYHLVDKRLADKRVELRIKTNNLDRQINR